MKTEMLHVDYSSRDPQALEAADEQAKKVYRKHGCFLAKGLLSKKDTAPILAYLHGLIRLRMQLAGIETGPDPDGLTRFDDGFVRLSKADRRHGSAIFDACRRLLPLHELSVDPKLIGLARMLMGTDTIIASDIKAIRIDHPDEDTYLFDWHQDYPYVMDSEDAVVFWIPMHDVDETNGCLKVAVGSHKLGVLKVRVLDPRNKRDNKQKFMEIDDKTVVHQFPQISVPAEAGDALVFSTMMLHTSQPNRSSRARWTAQIRFGNFEHPLAVKRSWPGSLRDGSWFDDRHPEHVVNLDEVKQAMQT